MRLVASWPVTLTVGVMLLVACSGPDPTPAATAIPAVPALTRTPTQEITATPTQTSSLSPTPTPTRESLFGKSLYTIAGNVGLGATWSNYEWTEWYFSVEDFYWEQWLKKDRFFLRVGNQIPTTMINSFRFKDVRKPYVSLSRAFLANLAHPDLLPAKKPVLMKSQMETPH